MLNLKKVIALVCVFAMVLTTVAFGATYTDVAEDSAYYEAVETLNKLAIVTGYEDGTFKPEDGVTRAEMAALIARIQGYGETAKANANTAFTDVPASHWASGYIANASGMGIINGYGDGTFGPEDPVLYEQAVKMVMATLGYTPFAEKNGGYPTGYLAAAQRYDVSLAVANAAVGQAANRGTVAQLLANAIDTPLMVQSKWNTNGEVEYVIADGKGDTDYKTLMSENLGYVKVRGIVEENPYVNIGTAFSKTIDTEADAKVRLVVKDTFDSINKDFKWSTDGKTYEGKKEFLVGDTDVADYIGRSVIIYVKKVADDYEVVSVAVDTNRNDELVIALGQYDDYDSTDKEIDYYKEGANSLSYADVDGAVAIYNNEGMALGTALGKIDKLNGGSITLIDNDDTNGYDVAIVKMAATGVVDEVSAKAVTLKNDADLATGSMNKINLNIDESKVVKFFKDGAEIEASELVEWDILSIYAENKNSNYIVADVVANQVVGTITSKKGSTTSFGGSAYKVGDAWYDVAKGVYDEGMDINEGGTFYIDEFGKIAAFVEDSALAGGAAANYAYVKGVAVDAAKFGAGDVWEVQMQLITAEGVEVFDLKYNAKIDATTLNIKNWKDDEGDTNPANDDGKFTAADTGWTQYNTVVKALEGNVVQFVKAAGYISAITTAGYKKTGADEANFVNGQISGIVKYDAENSRMIGTNGGYVEADALVFITGSDATKCKLGTLADLADQNTYTSVASYKDKKADYANILVVDAAEVAAASTTDAIAVITEVGSATDDDGQSIQAIQYLQNGEVASVVTTPEAVDARLTAGDIVKIKLGSEGVATDIKLIWNFGDTVRANKGLSAAAGAEVEPSIAVDNTTGEAFFGGYVTSFAKNSKLAVIQGKEVKLTSAEHVYVIDPTGRELGIDTGAAGDFTYYEALYDGTGFVTIKDAEGKAIAALPGEIDVTTAQKYADHVYVRLYEDKVVDVVIVKGAELDIEGVESVVTDAVTFDPSDLGGMMAATLGDYEYEIAGDVITVTGDANKITGWTAFNSSNVAEQDGYFVPVRFEYTGTKDIRFINGTKAEKSLSNVAGPFDLVTRLEVDGTNADDATVYIGGQKYTVTFDVTLLP
jgi:hypothetical protein